MMDAGFHNETVYCSERYLSVRFVVISGPSCGGKTTLSKTIERNVPSCKLMIKHTDRSKRAGEINNEDYYFVDRDSYENDQNSGRFIISDERYGHRYGLAFDEIDKAIRTDKIPAVILDPDAALAFRDVYRHSIILFVAPLDIGTVQQRIDRRDDTDDEKAKRLALLTHEYSMRDRFDLNCSGENEEALFSEINRRIRNGV